jgi:thioredoxin reductase
LSIELMFPKAARRYSTARHDPFTRESSVRGVYVAGDAARDVLLVAVAIAEGAKAAVAVNRALLQEDGLG